MIRPTKRFGTKSSIIRAIAVFIAISSITITFIRCTANWIWQSAVIFVVTCFSWKRYQEIALNETILTVLETALDKIVNMAFNWVIITYQVVLCKILHQSKLQSQQLNCNHIFGIYILNWVIHTQSHQYKVALQRIIIKV